jgi:hypothetical protein
MRKHHSVYFQLWKKVEQEAKWCREYGHDILKRWDDHSKYCTPEQKEWANKNVRRYEQISWRRAVLVAYLENQRTNWYCVEFLKYKEQKKRMEKK